MKAWHADLAALSPVEHRGTRWYKREDLFAPLGPGAINGAKCRQLIHLLAGARDAGYTSVVTGASVLSPQVSMTAVVGRYLGMPVTVVLGATRAEAAARHPNVRIAAEAGAGFVFTPVAYNTALQSACARLAESPGVYWLRYGITTPAGAGAGEVERFHAVGARQVANLPDAVRVLVVPFGSGNSATSVLYGLALHPPANLERVVLAGIGPCRLDWMWRRLGQVEQASGMPVRHLYRAHYPRHAGLQAEHRRAAPHPRWHLDHVDLHGAGVVRYADRWPATRDGIAFHPTYEGKIVRHLDCRVGLYPWWAESETALWVVGGEANLRAALAAARSAGTPV